MVSNLMACHFIPLSAYCAFTTAILSVQKILEILNWYSKDYISSFPLSIRIVFGGKCLFQQNQFWTRRRVVFVTDINTSLLIGFQGNITLKRIIQSGNHLFLVVSYKCRIVKCIE